MLRGAKRLRIVRGFLIRALPQIGQGKIDSTIIQVSEAIDHGPTPDAGDRW